MICLSIPLPVLRSAALVLLATALAGAPARAAEAPSIVFVSRALLKEPDPGSRRSAIERAASGRLLVREASGQLRVLVDRLAGTHPAAPADVMDPEVSYDAGKIVFAGFSVEEGAWRIY